MFDLNWDDLRFLLVAIRLGSLAAAGRALDVDPTTVGRRITALEKRLGTQLLLRIDHGFRPAPSLQGVLGPLERLEMDVRAIAGLIHGHDTKLEGLVRVTATESFCAHLIAPSLATFRERFPGIDIDLVADSRYLDLASEDLDLAVRLARPVEPSLYARKIGEVSYRLYAGAAYIDRHGAPDLSTGCAGHSVIGISSIANGAPEVQWLHQHAYAATTVIRSNSILSRLATAEAGLGLTVLPRFIADRGALIALDTPSPPVREVWTAVHRDKRNLSRIRAVSQFLGELMKIGGPMRADECDTDDKRRGRARD